MRAAQRLAVASDKVRTDCIEVSEFPDLAERYEVSGVPMAVFNDAHELVGAAPEEVFLKHVLEAGGQSH